MSENTIEIRTVCDPIGLYSEHHDKPMAVVALGGGDVRAMRWNHTRDLAGNHEEAARGLLSWLGLDAGGPMRSREGVYGERIHEAVAVPRPD